MANYPNSVPSFTTKSAGQTIQPGHVNDVQDEVVAIGTDLLKAWTSFSPTWTNLTVGNASFNGGKYLKIGGLVHFRIDLVAGTTTVVGQAFVDFPVAAAGAISFTVAKGEVVDVSTGDSFPLHARLISSTRMQLFVDNGTKNVVIDAAVPFAWAVSDELHLIGFYEV